MGTNTSFFNPESQAMSGFWAPEVYRIDYKLNMFFSADWKDNLNNILENFNIGVAVSASPKGPFVHLMIDQYSILVIQYLMQMSLKMMMDSIIFIVQEHIINIPWRAR